MKKTKIFQINDNITINEQVFQKKITALVIKNLIFQLGNIEIDLDADRTLIFKITLNVIDKDEKNIKLALNNFEKQFNEMFFYFVSLKSKIIIRLG